MGLPGRRRLVRPSRRRGGRRLGRGPSDRPRPYALGDAWPNFIPERDPERLRAAYGTDVWERLQAVRACWDPDDVFSAGHAITLP